MDFRRWWWFCHLHRCFGCLDPAHEVRLPFSVLLYENVVAYRPRPSTRLHQRYMISSIRYQASFLIRRCHGGDSSRGAIHAFSADAYAGSGSRSMTVSTTWQTGSNLPACPVVALLPPAPCCALTPCSRLAYFVQSCPARPGHRIYHCTLLTWAKRQKSVGVACS